jgi:cytochrome c2
MTIPHPVRVGVLVIAATSFYTYVGQMVPQKEVLPPQETVIRADLTTADMVKVGREIMDGKGLCFTCHTIGKTGALRFPDLEGVDTRAQTRVPGLTDIEYFAQSIYEPEKFIVPGFNPGMPVINKPPIGLNDQEILCVIAYLQTLGGMPTVTLQTSHHYYTPAGAAPGGAPAPATASAAGAAPGGAPAPGAAQGGAPAPPTTPAAGAKPGVAPAPAIPGVAPGGAPAAPVPATPPAPGAKPGGAPAPAAPTKGTR